MRELLLRIISDGRTSMRRQRTGTDEHLEQLDHFELAENFSIEKRPHRR
jgi:hypothetical protein